LSHPKVQFLRAEKIRAIPEEENVLIELDGEQPGFLPAVFETVPAIIRVKGVL